MVEDIFVSNNKNKWELLENYNKKMENKSIEKLSVEEIQEFTTCFKLSSYNLAYSRTHFPNSKTTAYLNQLVSISHNKLYVRDNAKGFSLKKYLLVDFVNSIFNNRNYIITATIIFLVGFILATLMTVSDTNNAFIFMDENTLANVDMTTSSREWNYPIMSSIIMSNNIKVCITGIIYGITAGLGTIYVLFFNGLTLGALGAYIASSGGSMINFSALILPHGFIELTAIFISGGGGLLIGKHLLIPGDYLRKDSIVIGAKEAFNLLPGIVIMLVIAGLIEGFFTPININPIVKLVFAGVTLIGMIAYYLNCMKRIKNKKQQ